MSSRSGHHHSSGRPSVPEHDLAKIFGFIDSKATNGYTVTAFFRLSDF
jgi:hypothetical protein